MNSNSANFTFFPKCEYCGNQHSGVCPKVKAIEYNRDGTKKRVEFHSTNPVAQYVDIWDNLVKPFLESK